MATISIQSRTTPTIRITVKEGGRAKDISSASRKDLCWKNAKGNEIRRALAFSSNGKDGQLQLTMTVADTTLPSSVDSFTIAAVLDLTMDSWDGSTQEPITIEIRDHGLAKRQ